MTADKVDLKKQIATYTAPRGRFEIVTVAPAQFVMIDGHGDPNTSPVYRDALTTIYPVAYRLKFASKRLGRDYVVPPLEALWWADDMSAFTSTRDKARWHWTLLGRVPDWLGPGDVAAAIAGAEDLPLRDAVRLDALDEGLAVQTLHIGPYDAEGPVLARMHEEFIPAHGLTMTGRHHEIYLRDARRTAPERLRTILRQPVTRAVP